MSDEATPVIFGEALYIDGVMEELTTADFKVQSFKRSNGGCSLLVLLAEGAANDERFVHVHKYFAGLVDMNALARAQAL